MQLLKKQDLQLCLQKGCLHIAPFTFISVLSFIVLWRNLESTLEYGDTLNVMDWRRDSGTPAAFNSPGRCILVLIMFCFLIMLQAIISIAQGFEMVSSKKVTVEWCAYEPCPIPTPHVPTRHRPGILSSLKTCITG